MFFGGEKSEKKEPRKLFLKHILRKVFLEDWPMKLIALVITLALWLGVTGLSTPTVSRFGSVPLTLRISNDSEITNTPLQEVDIVVSGDKRKIAQINKADLIVSVDLTDTPAGDKVIQLAPENVSVSLPTGIKLEEIQPNRIAVKLEAVEEKDIPVKVETDGAAADGFEVYSETAVPGTVRVRGPASFIRSLSFVSTDKIDLANGNADFSAKQVAISVSNPKATVLETVVDVTVRIGERRVERLFHLAARSGGVMKNVSAVLFGPRSILEKIHPEELHVEILKTETGEDSPQLILPAAMQGNVEIRKLKINS